MGAHVEVEASVGGHVRPEQRGERMQVARCQPALPFWPGEHLLDHERVDVDHAVLEQVEAEHAHLLVFAPVARHLAAAGKEDEVVGRVPLLHHVQPVVDLGPERAVVQVAGEEHRLDRFPKLHQRLVSRVLGVLAGEAAQDGFRLRRA